MTNAQSGTAKRFFLFNVQETYEVEAATREDALDLLNDSEAPERDTLVRQIGRDVLEV